jgi:predicted dehydrogenase
MPQEMSPRIVSRRNFLAVGLGGAIAALAPAQIGRRMRYGIVGAGNRGRNTHMPILRRHVPEVEIAAICDITPANLQTALNANPGAKGYSDYRRMLAEEPGLDAVLVVVPNFLHAEVALAAMEAGKHVLVEKPMALSLADADRMIATGRKKNRVLQVGLQSRYSEVYARMAQMIREGTIGDVSYMFASLFRGDWNPKSWQYTDPATGKSTNWRFLTKTAGSSLLEDGIHELDAIHWLVDCDPVWIEAQGGNNVFRDRETIDNAGLLVRFSNGAQLTFGYTIFTAGKASYTRLVRIMGSKAEMRLEGTRGKFEIVLAPYDSPNAVKEQRIPVSDQRADESFWAESGKSIDFDVETYREHRAFLNSITTGAPVHADGKVGRDAIHISMAAERSLRNGRIYKWNEEEGI